MAIVADSTASLPAGVVAGLPLYIVPFEVHHADRVYFDGVDIEPASFYEIQAQGGATPTTSAPQPASFLDAFCRAAEHASDIVCLTLAASLSAANASAELAQAEAMTALPGVGITLVDSRTAGVAEGLVALEAARLAKAGADRAQTLATIDKRISDVWFVGSLETLYYVWKGGRVPRVAMWLGNLLGVKPILELGAGRIGMLERPRTNARALDRLVALVAKRLDGKPGRVAVAHAAAPERADELARRLSAEINLVELFVTEFTPVIGAHTGPGLVGCAVHPVEP